LRESWDGRVEMAVDKIEALIVGEGEVAGYHGVDFGWRFLEE
jgi:hypothetical protein